MIYSHSIIVKNKYIKNKYQNKINIKKLKLSIRN